MLFLETASAQRQIGSTLRPGNKSETLFCGAIIGYHRGIRTVKSSSKGYLQNLGIIGNQNETEATACDESHAWYCWP
jgi:hypothetical protein